MDDEQAIAAPRTPSVFLSYAFEDGALAEKIAVALQAKRIDTWWAAWCIRAGDSIRQRIDDGLGSCTHFIALLTPTSVTKPWVNAEMDAGFLLKMSLRARFIPLRCGLPVSALPLLLQGLLSPEIDAAALNIDQLVNDVHGVTRKPALGPAPTIADVQPIAAAGYSRAAIALAKLFVERAKNATRLDPNFTIATLSTELLLSEEDVRDAIHELRGCVVHHANGIVHATDELFVRFDRFWMPWNPEDDALRIATGFVNDPAFPKQPEQMAKLLGWSPRRLNPAIAYLAERNYIRAMVSHTGGPWRFAVVMKTDETRRFLKHRS